MTSRELRKKWVEALRSGKYKHCRRWLHDGEGYDCMGVLCIVYGLKPEKTPEGYVFDGKRDIVPMAVAKAVKLRTRIGLYEIEGGDQFSLNDLNDLDFSFRELADIIESEPKGLFYD